jgi:hypothetical protein
MPWDVILQLGVAAGFAAAAIGAGLALKVMFDAWRKGDLVSRTVHEGTMKILLDANAALREDLQATTAENSRLASALERNTDLLATISGDLRLALDRQRR